MNSSFVDIDTPQKNPAVLIYVKAAVAAAPSQRRISRQRVKTRMFSLAGRHLNATAESMIILSGQRQWI